MITDEQKDQISEMEKEIWETYHSGGAFAHNIISTTLKVMSETSREDADRIYSELLEEGF